MLQLVLYVWVKPHDLANSIVRLDATVGRYVPVLHATCCPR